MWTLVNGFVWNNGIIWSIFFSVEKNKKNYKIAKFVKQQRIFFFHGQKVESSKFDF